MESESAEVSRGQCNLLASSDKIDKLVTALVAVQLKMPTVSKTKVNPFFKSKYADLSSVVEAAAPIIGAEGLAVSQFVSNVGGQTTLKTFVMHSSGQWVGDEMLLLVSKGTPQEQGSAITYARRYAYCAALGIVSDEDDDGNGTNSRPTSPEAKSQAPATKPTQATAKTTRVKAPAKTETTTPNLAGLFAIKDRSGLSVVPGEDGERHKWATKILGRDVASFKDLTEADITILKKEAKAQAIASPGPTGNSPDLFPGEDPERPF